MKEASEKTHKKKIKALKKLMKTLGDSCSKGKKEARLAREEAKLAGVAAAIYIAVLRMDMDRRKKRKKAEKAQGKRDERQGRAKERKEEQKAKGAAKSP